MTKLTRSESNQPRLAKISGEPENSTIAVAIAHKPTGPGSLPKVVASGRGTIADKILEIAFAEGVKVREDADLAELLAAADIDSEILSKPSSRLPRFYDMCTWQTARSSQKRDRQDDKRRDYL